MTAETTYQLELLDTGEIFNGLTYDESYAMFEKYGSEGHRPVIRIYPVPEYKAP